MVHKAVNGLCFVFFKKTKGLLPLRDPFVFILQYTLFKTRLYCEVLNVNILNQRNIHKRTNIFVPDYFCNLKAETDLHNVYKRSMCLTREESGGWVVIKWNLCELNWNVTMLF